MKARMQEKSKRSLVFAVVAVVTLGSTIASAGLGRGASGKLAETRARLLSTGSSVADADKNRGGGGETSPRAVPELRLGTQDLDMARLATSTGDRGTAASALVRVLDRADRIDRGRSLIASLVAAKLFDGVAERVDADPALLDDGRLVAALRRMSFVSSRRPLEGERRHAIGVLAGVPAQVPIRTAGFAESTATQAMEDVNAALHEMEDSALAGDIKQCETAAQKPMGLAKQVTVGPSICKSVLRVAESGRRLRSLQARAAAHARRSSTKTARATVTL
jgi:hypothetical protein